MRACRQCGCTDDNCRACIARTGRPCSWVERDLCSACVKPATNGHRVRPLERVLQELAADGIEAHVNGDPNMPEESARALGSIMRAAAQHLLEMPLTAGQKAKRLVLIKERHAAYLARRGMSPADLDLEEPAEEEVDDLFDALSRSVSEADTKPGVLEDQEAEEEVELVEELPPLDMADNTDLLEVSDLEDE